MWCEFKGLLRFVDFIGFGTTRPCTIVANVYKVFHSYEQSNRILQENLMHLLSAGRIVKLKPNEIAYI